MPGKVLRGWMMRATELAPKGDLIAVGLPGIASGSLVDPFE
jgi:hypothetical protein